MGRLRSGGRRRDGDIRVSPKVLSDSRYLKVFLRSFEDRVEIIGKQIAPSNQAIAELRIRFR
jgi:hypothetical protein